MTLIIIVITCLCSFLGFSNSSLLEKYKFYPYRMYRHGEYYRWITYGFVHANSSHLLFNMFTLYFAGRNAEMIFQPSFIFVIFYLLALVVCSIPDYFQQKNNPYYSAVGASGAISAALFSMMLFSPWGLIYVYFIPIYFILFAFLYLGYSFYMSKQNSDNVGHLAHLTGALFGIVATILYVPDSLSIFIRELSHVPFLN